MPIDYKRVLRGAARRRGAGGPAQLAVVGGALMGKPTGFLEWSRLVPAKRAVAERLRDWREVEAPPARPRRDAIRAAGRPLHGLRRAVLHAGLPARQPDPRLRRPRVDAIAGATRTAGSRRRTTSRSSPAGCARRRARPRACSAIDGAPVTIEATREGDHRARVRRGLGRAAAAARAHRQARRDRRLGPGRARRGAPAQPRRPHGDRVRGRGARRRPAALRHPRLQAREARDRSPARDPRGRGRRAALRRDRRRRPDVGPRCAPSTTRS